MDITLVILFSFLVIITITFFVYTYNIKETSENLNVKIRPLVSGNTDKLPNKDFYVIPDFHEKRKFIGDEVFVNFNFSTKFVVFNSSMTLMGLECGAGIYASQFTDEQKTNIKNNNLVKANDIIILTYTKKNRDRLFWKSRRNISFIDLSKSIDELCQFAKEIAPQDEKFNEWERVNEETISKFKKKLENKPRIKEYFEELEKYKGTTEYNDRASNFILSITYKYENDKDIFIADYSIHPIDKLWGKVNQVIPSKYIDSSEVIKECQKI
jgi:carboxylesterase type B